MRFTEAEIELAREFRQLGLEWTPKAGNYVYDETGFCEKPSPFQHRVYFILNYPFFVRMVGGVEKCKQMMTWLPTWEDARTILRELRVPDSEIASAIATSLESDQERLVLYQLIADCLACQHH